MLLICKFVLMNKITHKNNSNSMQATYSFKKNQRKPLPTNKTMENKIAPNFSGDSADTIYFVTVDSRGAHHHASDLECYKEESVSRSYFKRHIQKNPSYINVKSQVARLCGLDLELYFVDHPSNEYTNHSDLFKSKDEGEKDIRAEDYNKINAIATLLCFNPHTGYYDHIVKDKAYVIVNDGTTELSKRQVWGIQEFIRETKDYYHKDGHHYSHEAKMKLLGWAHDYVQGIWAPHSIYETRHERHLRHLHHHKKLHIKENSSNGDHIKHDEHNSYWKKMAKMNSGVTDAATYHHGSKNGHQNKERRILGHQKHHHNNPFLGIISRCTTA